MRPAQLAHQGGDNYRRGRSVIPAAAVSGSDRLAAYGGGFAPATPLKTRTKSSYEENKKRSALSRWSGRRTMRLKRRLTKNLPELPPTR